MIYGSRAIIDPTTPDPTHYLTPIVFEPSPTLRKPLDGLISLVLAARIIEMDCLARLLDSPDGREGRLWEVTDCLLAGFKIL